MGTVKYSGPMASFHCPTEATIRSLKVHFSPKQLGEGTPSPENIRPIEGWDGVSVHNDKDGIVIPEEYQKVEYLESDGGQYFWTDINVQEGLAVESVQSFLGAQDNYLFGGTVDSANNRSCFNGMYNRHVQGAYPNNYYNTNHSLSLSTVYRIKTTHKDGIITVDVDGVSTWTQNRGGTIVETGRKCICFGASNGAGDVLAKYLYRGRVYSLTIRKDENRLANFIPCRRKSDDKPGMYDTVTQTFFINQGTGEFICGPDIGQTTDYEFGVLGKNKLDVSTYIDNEYVKSDGTFATNNSFRRTDYLHLSPGEYIYSSVKNDSITAYSRVCGYAKDKTFVSMLNEQSKNSENFAMTFTVPDNVYYIVLQSYKSTSQEQLELGSSATTYEPYDPNKTVYGGWVDLITGEVCEEYGLITVDDSVSINAPNASGNEPWKHRWSIRKWNYDASSWYYKNNTGILLCDRLNKVKSATENGQIYGVTVEARIYVYDNEITSIEEFHNKYDGMKLCAPLHDNCKITYHLPPHSTTLKTFLAKNNVWSNADYVEVEYDLHETQTILARKQFIIANQPHVVKPAAAPLQNFVTDMAAPLKECKVHFSPVQEGEGDPSPENVRAISGWTGIEAWRAGKNLINESYLADGDNYPNAGGYGYYYTNDIQLVPNTKYRFVWYDYDNTALSELGVTNIHLYVSGASEYIVNNANYRQYSSGFITPTTGIIRLGIYHPSSLQRQDVLDAIFNNGKLMLQVGTDDIAYEPYSGTTLPIDWASEAGTVYGGYVDLVTGEVWVEWKYIDLTTANWTQFSVGTSVITASVFPGTISSRNNGFCNILPMVPNPNVFGIEGVDWNNNRLNLCLSVSREITTLADFKVWLQTLKDGGITPCIVAKYGEPALVTTLTPTTLKTLRGTNNIWASNGGDNIEIAYWKH